MRINQAVLSFLVANPFGWLADWAGGIPLIVVIVLFHVLGLGLIRQMALRVSGGIMERHHPTYVFVIVMGAATLFATTLHGLEAMIWAAAYTALGALPSFKTATLYSLNAMTSLGHDTQVLEERWRLMGAIEALNGVLLFGLSTAFLFGMIARVWKLDSK